MPNKFIDISYSCHCKLIPLHAIWHALRNSHFSTSVHKTQKLNLRFLVFVHINTLHENWLKNKVKKCYKNFHRPQDFQVAMVCFGLPRPATWSYLAADCQPTAPVPSVSLVQSAGILYRIIWSHQTSNQTSLIVSDTSWKHFYFVDTSRPSTIALLQRIRDVCRCAIQSD